MRRVFAGAASALIVVSSSSPVAAARPKAAAASTAVRIDKARIDRALAGMVTDGRAAGVSALVWKDGREVYFGTAGYADREAKRPMRRDTLVQIYSMTKPVTGTALMQLWEAGRFGIDEPLAKYLPEFAGVKGADGKLQRMKDEDIRRLNFAPLKLTMGGAGLVSSIDEYMRFARMLLNHGTLDGARILRPSTVKLMSTDQLDPKITERLWLPGKGNGGFGIDFFVRTGQPKNPAENRGAVGEFFWDGAASTLFWVDPANKLTAVFFVQSMPFDGTLHRDFRRAVYGDNYLGPKGD